jgi:quercetin dioxygenase-like cupin family protein
MNTKAKFVLFPIMSILLIAAYAIAQEMSHGGNVSDRKLTTIPPLPTCARGAVLSGDPSKGGSIIFASIATGCTIPWHWHTPTEQVVISGGVGRIDVKGQKSMTLRSGGYAMLPSKHIHQFHCSQACQVFVYSDVAFDLHYVNAKGDEITPDQANKAVKQTAATEMK